jgi:hypothetical protein
LPDEPALLDDLKTLRRRGITQLASLDVPALRQVVRAAGRIGPDEPVGAYAIEAMLRDAVAQVGGDHGDAAALLFGLEVGARSDRPSELRRLAAELLGVGVEHFRHTQEPALVGQVVQLILGEAHRYQLRRARLREDVRTPVGSRLAVEWLSRFEAMYRIWSPVSGLGADLTAYRSTLLEQDRPWDREPDPSDPDDDGYTQERQAAGYVTFAFYHYTRALLALQQFKIQFGGLWLLPDAQAETDLRDAMYRVVLTSSNNERDDSYMRSLLADVPDQELHGFLVRVADDPIAKATHDEWQQWASSCKCAWTLGERHGREAFPTHRNHAEISEQCDLHILVAACSDYCLILDDAWDGIADWYHDVPMPQRRDVTGEEVYALRGRQRGSMFARRSTI